MPDSSENKLKKAFPLAGKRLFLFISNMKMSLRYKIILLVTLAILLPAMLLSVVVTSIGRQAIRSSIFSQQQATVKRLAERINSQLSRHQQLLQINRDIGRLAPAQRASAVRRIMAQGNAFAEIWVSDMRGRPKWSYRRGNTPVGRSEKVRMSVPFMKNYVSQLYLTGQREPYIIIGVALSGDGGMLAGRIELGQLWDWISEVRIGETGEAFVVDRKGNLIAHREPERVWAHSNFRELPIVKDYLDNYQVSPESWREYLDERGQKVVALYEPLPALGWAVISQAPSSEVYNPIARMRTNVFFWTLFWVTVFLFAALAFVRRITNPIELLQGQVRQISQGKLDVKLNIKTGDEIEELAQNIESMAADLKQLEELKQDLTRMIIHDLKSPLSGIMGSIDYMDSGLLGDFTADQKKIISLSKKSCETMLSMIQNLLDIARMEEGKLDLRRENVDIGELVKERFAQFEALAIAEKKELSVKAEPASIRVSAERHLVERVINNLVSNALHHTSSGGKIMLAARQVGGHAEISVSDDGVGIPAEYKDKIFEKFVQVKRKQVQLRTGAGLGLTFCKMVVESHGGTIRVESELNKGSSFIFTLPIG